MEESFNPYFEWLGIPKGQRPPNHYTLLGLKPTEGDPEVIARAADVRLAKVRMVRPGGQLGDWGRLLDQLSAAKVCLLDPAGRAAYDAGLSQYGSVPPAPQPPAATTVPPEPPPEPPPVARVHLPAAAPKESGNRWLSAVFAVLLAGLCVTVAWVFIEQRDRIASVERPQILEEAPQAYSDTELPPPPPPPVPAQPQAIVPDPTCPPATPELAPVPPRQPAQPEAALPADPEPGGPQPPPDLEPEPQPQPRPEPELPPGPATTKQAEFAKALSKARFSMFERDLPGARKHLEAAAATAKTPAEQSQLERLRTMLDYLDEFWNGIRQSLAKLESGSELVLKNGPVAIVEASSDHLAIHAGRPYNWRIDQIPTHILLAVAERGFPKDAMSRVIVGTFMAVDHRGHRGLARELWQQAAKAGEKVEHLMPELGIDYSAGSGGVQNRK